MEEFLQTAEAQILKEKRSVTTVSLITFVYQKTPLKKRVSITRRYL